MSGPPPSSSTAPADPLVLEIELNGASRRVARGATLADLVREVLPGARAYAVEVNRTVVARRELESRNVTAGDRIEIVTLVGGG